MSHGTGYHSAQIPLLQEAHFYVLLEYQEAWDGPQVLTCLFLSSLWISHTHSHPHLQAPLLYDDAQMSAPRCSPRHLSRAWRPHLISLQLYFTCSHLQICQNSRTPAQESHASRWQEHLRPPYAPQQFRPLAFFLAASSIGPQVC